MNRKSYPTDLTDAQWASVVSLIPLAKPGGRPRKTNVRQVLNAILYLFALEVRGICSPMIFRRGGRSISTCTDLIQYFSLDVEALAGLPPPDPA
jgi:transposase